MKWFFAVVVIALGTGSAGAQTPGGPANPPANAANNPSTVPFDADAAKLSPAEMLGRMDAEIKSMAATATAVGTQTLQAETAKDVNKTNCLKDAGSQLNKALESAREKRAELAGSKPAPGSNAVAQGIFSAFAATKSQFDKVKGEAAKCVGKDATTTGGTLVSTTIDPNLPKDKDTQPGGDVGGPVVIIVAPPPEATKSK